MKIGIISPGIDTLALFKFLPCYDNEYLIYVDQKGFPYEEKSFDFVIDSIKKAGKFLIEKGAEIIIVDPIYELELTRLGEDKKLRILPLFQKYLQDYAFKYSLIGKIGVLTDFSSFQKVQELLENEEKRYKPTQLQKEIKKFNYPFHYRIKPVSSWVYNIYDMGIHNPFLIRMLKYNLRYFKDAYVDTIIPMHYHYFRAQRTIRSFFNFKKTRFHDILAIEESFKNLTSSKSEGEKYTVSLWINQPSNFITRNKQVMWQMQKGKECKVNIVEI